MNILLINFDIESEMCISDECIKQQHDDNECLDDNLLRMEGLNVGMEQVYNGGSGEDKTIQTDVLRNK